MTEPEMETIDLNEIQLVREQMITDIKYYEKQLVDQVNPDFAQKLNDIIKKKYEFLASMEERLTVLMNEALEKLNRK